MGTEMTDEQLGALARRLADSGWKDPRVCNFDDIAREAARWAQERERERLEPLRVAVEAVDKANKSVAAHAMLFGDVRLAKLEARNATDRAIDTARTLLEKTE